MNIPPTPKKVKRKGCDALWLWFGLSRASFLRLPRVLMHEMPNEWQGKMAKLLEEYDDTFDFHDGPSFATNVSLKKCGKFVRCPQWILQYRHPDKEQINKVRSQWSLNKGD
jgi:hypothetical protein